jgi:hypothetical protein
MILETLTHCAPLDNYTSRTPQSQRASSAVSRVLIQDAFQEPSSNTSGDAAQEAAPYDLTSFHSCG